MLCVLVLLFQDGHSMLEIWNQESNQPLMEEDHSQIIYCMDNLMKI